jgi:signal transduction histidine kinase/streptogramin lyase
MRERAILVLAIACAGHQLLALDPNRRLSQYGHNAWRIQDGFLPGPPDQLGLTQAGDGYLWIATRSGLFRFDGVRLTAWRTPDGKQDRVYVPLSVKDGSLWVGRDTVLTHVLADGRVVNFDLPRVIQEVEDSDGALWVFSSPSSAAQRVCRIKDSAVRCLGAQDGLPPADLGFIQLGRDGSLWLASDITLTHWASHTLKTYTTKGLQSNAGQAGIHDVALTKDGTVWVAMTGPGEGLGLQRLVHDSLEPVRIAGFDGSRVDALSVYVDHENSVWVGTHEGLYRIIGNQVDHFGKMDGLSGDSVIAIHEDREGNLWIGTSEGLDCLRDLKAARFSKEEGLASTEVDGVIALKNGDVLLSGYMSLDAIRGGTVRSLRFGKGLPGRLASALFEDHAGRLWIGIDDGLYTFENGIFNQIRMPDGSNTGLVFAIAEDNAQNIWLTTEVNAKRLIRVRNGRVQGSFSTSQVPAARSIAADPRGGIWLGLVDGNLARFVDGKLELVKLPISVPRYATQISVDQNGAVLASSPSGLIGILSGNPRILSSRNGLPCDDAMGFTRDRQGAFWIYMACGLARISNSELQHWLQDPAMKVKPRVLDVFDGVRSGRAPFSPMALSSDGRIWFASGFALGVVDPAHLEQMSAPPPVHIESVIADHKAYSVKQGMRLPALTRDLQVDYTALSLGAPQKVYFRYRLEGRESEWQQPGTRRQAYYTDLRPGSYTFRVIACNNDGIWNEAGDTLQFSIDSAYYQTSWFRASLIGVFLVALWALYRFRLHQLAREYNAHLVGQVDERLRVARDLHDTLLQSFQGLIPVFQTARNLLPAQSDRAAEVLDEGLHDAAKAIVEGRNAIQNLRGTPSGERDLEATLTAAGQELAHSPEAEGNAPAFRVVVEGSRRALAPLLQDEIYRIGREMLRNAFRHAHAGRIEAEIRYERALFRMRVRDDGRGIDSSVLKKGARAGHWGVPGMHERAKSMGARFKIWSEPGAGTEAELTVPARIAYAKSPPATASGHSPAVDSKAAPNGGA